jgi:hypothetical protein
LLSSHGLLSLLRSRQRLIGSPQPEGKGADCSCILTNLGNGPIKLNARFGAPLSDITTAATAVREMKHLLSCNGHTSTPAEEIDFQIAISA